MKRLALTLGAAAVVFAGLVAPGLARDLTAVENAALEARIVSFSNAFKSRDMTALASVIPPKVINVMAAKFDLEPAQLIEAMGQAMEVAMQDVTLDGYAMDLENAATAETSTKRTYLLIPTTTRMTVDDETKVETTSQTLAFADDGTWYLVRIDDLQQVQFLTAAYPDFKGVDFPTGQVKILED